MSLLFGRAEQYSGKQRESLPIVNYNYAKLLRDYLESDEKRPRSLVGIKGQGKSFNTLYVLNELIQTNPSFLPVYYIYKLGSKLRMLDHLSIASAKSWGDRLRLLQKANEKKISSVASVKIYDDLQYICEDVAAGILREKFLVNLLAHALKDVRQGKKVLLISEDLLARYAEKLNIPEFDDLLLKFGMYPRVLDQVGIWKKYSERVDPIAMWEMPSLSKDEFYGLFRIFNLRADEAVAELLYKSAPIPRALVKFGRLFPTGEIKEEEVVRMIWDRVEPKINRAFRNYNKMFLTLRDATELDICSLNTRNLFDGVRRN